MPLLRTNKSLEQAIKKEVAKQTRHIHRKPAAVAMPDELKEVSLTAC